MNAVLDKYELEILKCVSARDGKYSAPDIHKMLHAAGMVLAGRETVRICLKKLRKKNMVKKSYVRTGLFSWTPYYQSLYPKEYLVQHVQAMGESQTAALLNEEKRRIRKARRKLAYNPFVIAEPIDCSPEEKQKILEMIKGLD